MYEVDAGERFAIRGPLGSGGVGMVFEALDRESNTIVALKTLRDITPEGLYRLKREFRLLQGIQHPNVCHHHELFEHAGRWFITMECVRGEDLLRHVREIDDASVIRSDESKVRAAFSQLAESLCALHEAGLVHRDLKPSNVIVAPDGRVVLIDFGFVEDTVPESSPQRSQSIVGTPIYMAPEQALAADAGAAADWYSFGVVLYEALTGQFPHDGDTPLAVLLNKQRIDPPRASTHVAGIPADLDGLCAELLQADPALRPTGAKVLRRLGNAPVRDSRPSFLSMPVGNAFVGRTGELARLRAAFDLDLQRTMTVLVEGPSGVGKTALVRRFTDEVGATGALVLGGRCFERESVPYKAFDSAIDALARYLRRLPDVEVAALLPRHPDLLVRMFPVLGAIRAMSAGSPSRGAIGDPQEQRNQAFAALREVLHRLASRRRVVLAIEDWQWADADSLVLARDLIRHRDSPPLLFVLTARPSDDPDTAARIDAISMPETVVIEVAALVESQALELAEQLKRSFAPSLDLDLHAIVRETQGHPLYISELVRYAATRGTTGTAIRLDEAILARIAELPAEARSIVEALAVTGEPLPVEVVRDIVDLPPVAVQRQVAALRVANIVRSSHTDGTIEPFHDRVRETMLEALSPEQRLAWHKKIAFAIEASPLARTRPELLLRHLEVAGEIARASTGATAAARRAVAAGAFERAASLFALALRSGQLDPAQMRATKIELGHALANGGHGRESAEAFLEAADGADPATSLDCHRVAAEQLLMIGDIERGLEILRALLAQVGVKMRGSASSALTSVIWARTRLRFRGLRWKERRTSQIASETLLRLDVLRAASHSLALVDNVRAADFNARWLLLALEVGESTRCAFALLTEAVYLSSQGGRGVERAKMLVETVRKLAGDAPEPALRGFVLMSEAAVEYWVCRLARADELFTEAEAVLREQTTGMLLELKSVRMFLSFTLRHRGSWARLRTLREEYVADAERCGDRYVLTSMNRYCSVLRLAADDPRGARDMIDGATWVLPTSAFHAQHWYELEARGEIAVYEDTVAKDMTILEPLFAGLERSMLTRVQTVRALSYSLRARIAMRVGGSDAPKIVAALVGKLEKVTNLRAGVFAALLGAGSAGMRGDQDTAVASLRTAIDRAKAADMKIHETCARRQLGRLLGGTEGANLVAYADATLAAEGVVAPARFADWFVPGLALATVR